MIPRSLLGNSCRDACPRNRTFNRSEIYDCEIVLDTILTPNYPIICEKINYRFNLDKVRVRQRKHDFSIIHLQDEKNSFVGSSQFKLERF